MRTKLFAYISFFLLGSVVIAQKPNCMIKAEIKTTAGPMSQTMLMTTFVKGEDMKIEIVRGKSYQYQVFVGDKVTMVSRDRSPNDICGQGTREELKDINDENKTTATYEDVEVEKTKKTTKILGYVCKQAIIKYKMVSMGFKMKQEVEVWYTEEIKTKINTDPSAPAGVSNPYTDAVTSLGGMVLKQTTKANGMKLVELEVTECKENIVEDSMITTDEILKDCKKMLTLKEYYDKMAALAAIQNNSIGR